MSNVAVPKKPKREMPVQHIQHMYDMPLLQQDSKKKLTLLFIVWYKKTLKATGKPIVVKNMVTGELYTTNKIQFKGYDVRMQFNNTVAEAKVCGATTVLEVWG
jgi:hypothetical protein